MRKYQGLIAGFNSNAGGMQHLRKPCFICNYCANQQLRQFRKSLLVKLSL